jgi:hypothetical protein
MKSLYQVSKKAVVFNDAAIERIGIILKDDVEKDTRTLNDPRFGGGFGFGLIACRPANGKEPDPANFWNECWELTSRTLDNIRIVDTDTNRVVTAELHIPAQAAPVMTLQWNYKMLANKIECKLVATPHPSDKPLFYKEPKLVFNGLQGFDKLIVRNKNHSVLNTFKLENYTNPTKSTCQIPYPSRWAYTFFKNPERITIYFDHACWRDWLDDANKAKPMSNKAMKYNGDLVLAPKYCLTQTGRLKSQAEVPRWDAPDVCGLILHAWEGGYGAPDCWNTFRPWPTKPAVLKSAIVIKEA